MNGKPLANEPRGSAKQRRVVHFAVTSEQFERLEDMAMMQDMNVSEYIRYSIFGREASR